MNGFEPRYELSMRATLVEFASLDARLLLGAYLREVLLRVYADSETQRNRPGLQRELALRLLARSNPLGDAFTRERLADFRGTAGTATAPAFADDVCHLGQQALAASGPEAWALCRRIQREAPDFDLELTPFAASRHALSLARALAVAAPLTAGEHHIVFRVWTGAFAQVLRTAYRRYTEVLDAWPEVVLETRRDFADTWPAFADPPQA